MHNNYSAPSLAPTVMYFWQNERWDLFQHRENLKGSLPKINFLKISQYIVVPYIRDIEMVDRKTFPDNNMIN